MESQDWPSSGHLTISDGALLAFTTVEKCTAWIDKKAPRIRFILGTLPYELAIAESDERHMPLYLDIRYDDSFICYQDQQLAARMLVKAEDYNRMKNVAKPGPNDPCPCGSGKKYKKCCGR